MKTKTFILKTIGFIFLAAVLAITLFPLIYAVASSFKTNMEIMSKPGSIFPSAPTWDNYSVAFSNPNFNVPRMLFNSVWYTLANVLIMLVISSMAGYVWARGRFPFKKTVFGCFISLMFIHTGGIGVYALFEILNAVNLSRSLFALVVVKAFGVPVTSMFLIRGYITSLPRALDEAAKIDGCSFFGAYRYIILPLLKPILATVGILSFQGSWNEYLMPTVFTITAPEQQTLIVGLMQLRSSSESATAWGLVLSGATIALLPVLGAYIFANKYFVSGLATGAVKE